jgi:hypothetical protein
VLRPIVDLQEIFDFEDEWDRGLQILSDAARQAVRSATTEAPKQAINTKRFKDQTGLLTSMIKGWVEISVPGGAIGEIGAYTYYASFVDEGTRPHEIRGNPTLTFKTADGRWVSTHVVHHPGTKPTGFGGVLYHSAEGIMIREVELGIDQLQRFLEG